MLRRIEVDFNTLTSDPVGLVKLGPMEALEDAAQQPLREGERVILWEPGLEVEAYLTYDAATDFWLARPDGATWRDVPDVPLESGQLSGEEK